MAGAILHWKTVLYAREMLREGYSLAEIADHLGVTVASLDLSLWRNYGVRW